MVFYMYVFYRENAEGSEGGNPAARKRFKRGTVSLPEPPYRTPSTRGEIRRFEGGDHTRRGEDTIIYGLPNLKIN